MQCPRCQQQNTSGANFCLKCGTPVTSTTEVGAPGASYAELQHALSEALEQQTATSEILRVISRSQIDVQPVFDTIARNGVRLCAASFSYVFRFDGELMHVVAHHNLSEEGLAALQRQWPMRPNRGSIPARAVLDRAVVHVQDALEEPDYPYLTTTRALGIRTMLTVPMLREGHPVGAIAVYRQKVEPFSERQIDLVQTFAAQAVIAIENVLLLNLLSNAVKFTPEGGRIRLKAALTDGSVEISVSDTGIGIAPEDQEMIFEEFRQVGGDDARKQEGTGLGLTLTKKFVEMHGGRIWVESEVGRGSTFTFTLPVT